MDDYFEKDVKGAPYLKVGMWHSAKWPLHMDFFENTPYNKSVIKRQPWSKIST
jgi:hypothetical protein